MRAETPTPAELLSAHERIRPHVHRTPVVTCRSLDEFTGARLFLKCENFQKVVAFKIRGATNAVLGLDGESASRGVATHSSGNHAAALALAARQRGIPAWIVMPENAPAIKRRAVAGYGGRVVTCAPTLEAREAGLASVLEETGAHFVPPFNDLRVVCGQSSVGLELLEDAEGLDAIVAPVGGGGLASGTCLAARARGKGCLVYGAEPGRADDAARSLAAGRIIRPENPDTIADGLRTALGPLTFEILRRHLDGIVTVSEDAIIRAMRLLWERAKLVVEPSGAVPLAALLEKRAEIRGARIGVILSGGNVDLDALPWMSAQS
jgi:threonine dehydratase